MTPETTHKEEVMTPQMFLQKEEQLDSDPDSSRIGNQTTFNPYLVRRPALFTI